MTGHYTRIRTQVPKAPRTVIVLTLLFLGALWSFVAYWAISSRDEAIDSTGEVLRRMNYGIEEQTRRLFASVDIFLVTCDRWLEANPKSDPRTDPFFAQLIEDFRAKTGKTIDIRLVAENGGLFYIPSSSPEPLARVGDREYFRGAMAMPERGLFVGSPTLSRATGQHGLPISLRLKRPSHGIAVVFAVIDLGALTALYEDQRHKPSGAIVLVRRDGVVLARAPGDAQFFGRSVAGGEIFRKHLPTKERDLILLDTTATDGLKKFASYSAMSDYPLVLVVSSGYDDALRSWKKHLLWIVLIAFGVTIAAVAAAVRSVRLLDSLALRSAELLHLATTDVLTGVRNRRHFVEVLEQEFARARRYDTPLTILSFDLDFFKRINDGYGHAVGDQALISFAEVAQKGLREMDLLGRIGGEEFAILLPSTPAADALAVAERVRKAVAEISIPTDNGMLKFTTSVGVTQMQSIDSSIDDLLRRADNALYEAKAGGRNRVVTI
jgi:diguanylate cyclase (GGDEF)-like protein